NQATSLDSGREPWPAVTPSGRDAGRIRTASVMSYRWGATRQADCRPGRRGHSTLPGGAMSRAVAGSQPPFTVVADYERLSAVRAAGPAGDESGSWPQSPGLTARPSLRPPEPYLFADAA